MKDNNKIKQIYKINNKIIIHNNKNKSSINPWVNKSNKILLVKNINMVLIL